LTSPHSANIDRAKVEQQCGGILARLQPVYAREEEFYGVRFAREQVLGIDGAMPAGYVFEGTPPFLWCGGSEILFNSATGPPRELLNQNHTTPGTSDRRH